MTEEITLAQLAAEIAQLRRQFETVNQRLDMIYGAVTRLADQGSPPSPPPATPAKKPRASGAGLSPEAMMSPDSMLDALRRHAVDLGMDIPTEIVDQLKSQPQPKAPTDDEPAATD